jgi:hypothetical protein
MNHCPDFLLGHRFLACNIGNRPATPTTDFLGVVLRHLQKGAIWDRFSAATRSISFVIRRGFQSKIANRFLGARVCILKPFKEFLTFKIVFAYSYLPQQPRVYTSPWGTCPDP